jgi:hypothetical protein
VSLARLLAVWLGLLVAPPAAPAGLGVDERAESALMERLAQAQAATTTGPAPFTTDGCSGGLSAGWELLAKRLPGFQQRYGSRPPWEACCVAHDRAYWRGETVDGFHRRLVVDKRLRECVAELGRAESGRIGRELGVAPDTVAAAFVAAGELMYTAVRVGGAPCTPLPWRWGYGWPSCARSRDPAS